jgi:hypothetical protein
MKFELSETQTDRIEFEETSFWFERVLERSNVRLFEATAAFARGSSN